MLAPVAGIVPFTPSPFAHHNRYTQPLYNVYAMSRVQWARDAAQLNPFHTDAFLFLDSDHYCSRNTDQLTPGKLSIFLHHLTRMLLTTWDYDAGTEVHGFDAAAFRQYVDVEKGPVQLARGTYQGLTLWPDATTSLTCSDWHKLLLTLAATTLLQTPSPLTHAPHEHAHTRTPKLLVGPVNRFTASPTPTHAPSISDNHSPVHPAPLPQASCLEAPLSTWMRPPRCSCCWPRKPCLRASWAPMKTC
jgi:hypothetical protein